MSTPFCHYTTYGIPDLKLNLVVIHGDDTGTKFYTNCQVMLWLPSAFGKLQEQARFADGYMLLEFVSVRTGGMGVVVVCREFHTCFADDNVFEQILERVRAFSSHNAVIFARITSVAARHFGMMRRTRQKRRTRWSSLTSFLFKEPTLTFALLHR